MSGYYAQGYHNDHQWTIYCQDCLNVLSHYIEDKTVDCIITSPPYFNRRAYGGQERNEGNLKKYTYARKGFPLPGEIGCDQTMLEYLSILKEVLQHCYRVLRDDKFLFINVNKYRQNTETFDFSSDIIQIARDVGFSHRDTFIWIKGNPRPGLSNCRPYYLDDSWEYVLQFSKGKGLIMRNQFDQIKGFSPNIRPNFFVANIGFAGGEYLGTYHQARFPKCLPRFALKLCAKPGDTVLDPFCGIGTTLVVGLELGLNVIGCDIVSRYCDGAITEIQKLSI